MGVEMIRPATHLDVNALVEMGRQFLLTTPYRHLIAENPEQMAVLVGQLIDHATGVVLVADHDGALTGMIGLLVTAHHLSAEPIAMEAFWWSTTPGDGVRLLRSAEQWATARGAVAMQMVAPDDRVGALYARMGYDLIERGYMRRLDS